MRDMNDMNDTRDVNTNAEMKKKNGANRVIQWKTHESSGASDAPRASEAPRRENVHYSRAYRDPTADVAIGNIMREERMKKKQADRKRQRSSNYQKERNRRRAEAWREAKAREAKALEAREAQMSTVHESNTPCAVQGGECHVEE